MSEPIPQTKPILSHAWWQPFRVPFGREFVAAHGTMAAREGIVLVMETDDGAVGLGEASPLPSYSGGSVAETGEAIETLVHGLIGRPADAAWCCDVALPGVSAGSSAAARFAVETAGADLAASAALMPLAVWMATWAGIDSPATTVPVNGTIDAGEPAAAATEARALVARGFETLKLKVGTGIDADLARIAAVREAVGDEVALRIDANGVWEPVEAMTILGRCQEFGIALCEQPISHLGPDALRRLARVRSSSPIPIAADESCRSVADLDSILAARAADAIVVKPMASGLREAVRMVARARERGVPVIVTTMFDAGVGTTAAMHLAALTGPSRLACGLATLDHLEHSLVQQEPAMVRGTVSPGDEPGLNLKLDMAAVERYATGPRREVSR